MRSDLIKEKYTGFPRENVAIHCPGQIKDIFSEPTQRNMGMQHTLLHFWKTNFSCPDEGQRSYEKK